MLLSRLGASKWLTFEALARGLVATCQALLKNKSGFYATRFLLGAFEAGYLPGAQTILS